MLYFRICFLYLKKSKASNSDFFSEYDVVSQTYDKAWGVQMGNHGKKALDEVFFPDKFFMLDLACGTGFMIKEALCKGVSECIIGVDGSEGMLKKAKLKIKSDKVKLIKGDILEEIKKLPDNCFDIVSFGWALSYIEKKDRKVLMENIRRVLKTGGVLVLIANCRGTIDIVERAYLRLMEKNPSRIKKISDMGINLIKDYFDLQKMAFDSNLLWQNGWNGTEEIVFDNGESAINWIRECGALAGMFQLMEMDDFWGELAKEIEMNKDNKIIITHKFSVGIVKKND